LSIGTAENPQSQHYTELLRVKQPLHCAISFHYSDRMLPVLHASADALLKRIRRTSFYYQRWNNTLAFSINNAYGRYARECAARYAAEHGTMDLPPSPLQEKGAAYFPRIFPADKARAYSQTITELLERNDSVVERPKESDLAARIRAPLRTLGTDILDAVRAPAIHDALLRFFRGHYRIEWITCFRTFPAKRVAGSWLWHSDSFPPHTCKLFLHLTPANVETGATEFMTLADTMAYRRAGYFGQFKDERFANLEEFAAAHHLPYRPFHFDAEPGDGTLFDMNFFHRAVRPEHAFRDVIQFYFLPSPIPWEQQYERDVEKLMAVTGNFPKNPRPGASVTASSQSMMM